MDKIKAKGVTTQDDLLKVSEGAIRDYMLPAKVQTALLAHLDAMRKV